MKKHIVLGLILATAPFSAVAGVLSISSPDIDQGVWEIETGVLVEDDNGKAARAAEYITEATYGLTPFWASAFEFTGEKEGGGGARYAATAWKNTFQFLKQADDMPLSAALRVQYEKAHLSGEADDIATRLLLRHQNDVIDARLNVGVKKKVGDQADGGLAGNLRSSLRYKWRDGLRPALDYLGDTGGLNHMQSFNRQDHRLGPVLYGSFGAFGYEAGYLAGISSGAPAHSVKLAVNYSF